MRNYEIRADIQHCNERNKNLNWTEHFCSYVLAENGEAAKKKGVKEVLSTRPASLSGLTRSASNGSERNFRNSGRN